MPQQSVPGNSPSHAFSRVPQADINRSQFDLSWTHKTTIDENLLYPLFHEEVVPGDTLSVSPTIVARMLTLIHPLMDSLYMDVHFWFVPLRLVWDKFQRQQGERPDPDSSIDFTTPVITVPNGGFGYGTIYDYMGYPTQTEGENGELDPIADYLRAYNLTYNTWYRDQNQIDSVLVPLGDGPDAATVYTLLKRGKRKDYFTSALPWPQKGDAVQLPLGVSAPVVGSAVGTGPEAQYRIPIDLNGVGPVSWFVNDTVVGGPGNPPWLTNAGGGGNPTDVKPVLNPDVLSFDLPVTGTADLSAATAVTINALRLAITTQQLLERDARGGTRYTEIIHSHFGVVSPDARLQRPEYLGGGSVPVLVHTVAQTSQGATSASGPGDLGAYATAMSRGGLGFRQSFTEHGVVLGIVSIRQEYTYQQGLARRHRRLTRYDRYLPTFANLGEQAILRQEILANNTEADNISTFGYAERWGEMRWHESIVTGAFRSNHPLTLDSWHLSQDFVDAGFALDQDFVEENAPVDRVVRNPDEAHFLVDCFFDVKAVRPMPIFSAPGLRIV